MDLVDQFLTKDIYNNSAWNHRYFIINNTRYSLIHNNRNLFWFFNPYETVSFSGWTKDVIDNEIDFTISKIKYAIDNESVWNYLRAIIKHDLLEYEKGTLKSFTVKTSSWKEYVLGWMNNPTYVISISLQAKWYVLIWFKYLIPLTCLKYIPSEESLN